MWLIALQMCENFPGFRNRDNLYQAVKRLFVFHQNILLRISSKNCV